MPHAKGVIRALGPSGKSGKAVFLAQSVKTLCPVRQYFPGIALVAHIPYNLVLMQVEFGQHGQRQLHCPHAGGQVAAVGGAHRDDMMAHAGCQAFQLGIGQVVYAVRQFQILQIGRKRFH